jgi:hypothetical protein
VRSEHVTSEPYFVAIAQHALDFSWRMQIIEIVTVSKIEFAAGFNHGHVGIHHHLTRSGHLLEFPAAGIVVPVPVTDWQTLGVVELEAEFPDACLDQRHIGFQIAIDHDVPARRQDQITR